MSLINMVSVLVNVVKMMSLVLYV